MSPKQAHWGPRPPAWPMPQCQKGLFGAKSLRGQRACGPCRPLRPSGLLGPAALLKPLGVTLGPSPCGAFPCGATGLRPARPFGPLTGLRPVGPSAPWALRALFLIFKRAFGPQLALRARLPAYGRAGLRPVPCGALPCGRLSCFHPGLRPGRLWPEARGLPALQAGQPCGLYPPGVSSPAGW